jgi:uncharacterized protein with gpF-like domain
VLAERVRNPIIPGTTKDRTGSAGILRRMYAEVRKRFDALQADVLAIFDRIPVYAINDERAPIVRYGLTPEALAGIAEELQAAIVRWIAAEREIDHVLWWEPYVDEAAQLGTAQTAANLGNLSTNYAAARGLETVIYSQPYRTRVAMAKFRSNEHWTGLAAEQRSTLAQVIGRAVADGKSPKAARDEIVEALGVGKSRAMLYAQTDITGTLREARWAEADDAAEALNLNIGLLWTSALIPTTRPWHASRNGQVYTTAEVKAFYGQRGNRYRCHCAQTECLLDVEGAPILTKKLKATMANEKKAWQSANDAE